MKKTLIFALSFSAVITLFVLTSISAYAQQSENIGPAQLQESDTYYSYDAASKTLTISGNGDMPDFTNTSGGETSQPWFSWRSDGSVEHVVVEDGVTGIGNYAFYNISTADLTLPSTLNSIGSYSFSGMSTVTEFTVPENVTSIPNNAFYQCYGLQALNIHSGVTSIGASAFEECLTLNSINFETDYMTVSIGRSAFLKCTGLTDVRVPLNASLSSYSLGFTKAKAGNTSSSINLLVYSDSSAYSYALKNAVNYTLINSIEIFEGGTVSRTYTDANLSEVMCFSFVCPATDGYTFFSQGSIDVDCMLYSSDGELLASSSDISAFDLNFNIKYTLLQGEEYTFKVTSVNSRGDYSVSLLIDHNMSVTGIVAPTVKTDGYTTYTCSICGENFNADFVPRLGRAVTGRAVELMSPDGDTQNGEYIANAVIYNEELEPVCTTDENGYFTYDYAYGFIIIDSGHGAPRAIVINNQSSDLGELALVNCDLNNDGYINAKDFAIYKKQNSNEWKYASDFYTVGKIEESIYDNLG